MVERIVSGVIALCLVVGSVVWGGELGLELIVALVVLIGLDEWCRMTAKASYRSVFPILSVAGLGFYAAVVWGEPIWLWPVMAITVLIVLCYGLLVVPDTRDASRQIQSMLTGLLYLPGLLIFIPWIRDDLGLDWVFLFLVVTWCGDTGAYFAGRAFGRRKLFERISPKKTWEGAFGGFALSIVGAFVMWYFASHIQADSLLANIEWFHIAILGGLINVSGVVGDLTESLFKRAYDIKDSGWIMPGHGGIVDRVDSILFTAPVTWLYAFGMGFC